MSPPEVVYPGRLRFTCTQCGDCCRDWNVPLAVGERERLVAIDWRGRVDSLVGVDTTARVNVGREARVRLARRADGACVYLGRENDCLLHTHFGAAAKPLACSLYPFSLLALGDDRVAVDVAFSCRAVSLGLGALLADQAGHLEELAGLQGPATSPVRHRLTGTRDASPAVVWEVETQVLAYLRDESLGLLDRIRCALEYLRLATTGDPGTPAAAVLRRTIGQAMPGLVRKRPLAALTLDATQSAVLGLWTYLSLNPPPADLHSWPPRQQRREAERRAALADAFRERRGQPWIANRELEAGFAEVDAVSISGLGATADAVLATFFEAKIIGQRFRRAGDEDIALVDGAQRLFLGYAMALWAAKALAAERGSARAEEVDLRAALRLLDRTLGELKTSSLAKRQQEAWDFVIADTDLAIVAAASLLQR